MTRRYFDSEEQVWRELPKDYDWEKRVWQGEGVRLKPGEVDWDAEWYYRGLKKPSSQEEAKTHEREAKRLLEEQARRQHEAETHQREENEKREQEAKRVGEWKKLPEEQKNEILYQKQRKNHYTICTSLAGQAFSDIRKYRKDAERFPLLGYSLRLFGLGPRPDHIHKVKILRERLVTFVRGLPTQSQNISLPIAYVYGVLMHEVKPAVDSTGKYSIIHSDLLDKFQSLLAGGMQLKIILGDYNPAFQQISNIIIEYVPENTLHGFNLEKTPDIESFNPTFR